MPTANNTESDNAPTGEPGQQGSGNVNADTNPNGNADQTPASDQRDVPATGQRDVPAAQTRASDAGPNFGEVLAAVQAMPEQVVRAIREATAPARAPKTSSGNAGTGNQGSGSQTATQTGSQGSSGGTSQTPGKRTFGQWWFGG